MKSEEEIDSIFKRKLEDPENHSVYNEDDWDALEQMLDAGKKRRGIVYWLPIASAAAAMLLIFLGWWFLKPVQVIDKSNKEIVAQKSKIEQNQPITNNAQQQTEANNEHTKLAAENKNQNAQSQTNSEHAKLATTNNSQSTQQNNLNSKANKQLKGSSGALQSQNYIAFTNARSKHLSTITNNSDNAYGKNNNGNIPVNDDGSSQHIVSTSSNANGLAVMNTQTNNTYLASSLIKSSSNFNTIGSPDFEAIMNDEIIAEGKANTNKKINRLDKPNKTQFALTVFASPDVNGVNSFNEYTMVGTNFGALFTTSGIFKKFYLSTGVSYASKPYAASIESYTAKIELKWTPIGVTADCKMLDIPINIGYQVFKNRNNKISLGTGLSSYIMLNERYTYTYTDPHPNWPQSWTVPHSKNNFMSVANINATYERRLNSKFGLSVQPYLKLPLTGIGYSDARLESAGVAVGLTWNINPFKKQ